MDDTLFIEIQRLCKLAHERGLQEIALSRPGFSVKMTAPASGVVTVAMPMPVHPMVATTAPSVEAAQTPQQPEGYVVASPLVGIFYRSSSPDTPAFVEVGDTVEAGQTIGIVEAMKVFNEITTEHAGTVIAVPAENGKLVQADQPLVIIDAID